jgi:hypothetical protein
MPTPQTVPLDAASVAQAATSMASRIAMILSFMAQAVKILSRKSCRTASMSWRDAGQSAQKIKLAPGGFDAGDFEIKKACARQDASLFMTVADARTAIDMASGQSDFYLKT